MEKHGGGARVRAVAYLPADRPGFRLVKVAALGDGLAYQVQGPGHFEPAAHAMLYGER